MIERELRVPVPSERVWEALTDPEAVQAWLGADVEWDLRPGGRARFRGRGGDADRHGTVAEVDPGRRLRFRWWPAGEEERVSEVAYEIEEAGGVTVLRVTETIPAGLRAAQGAAGPGATVLAGATTRARTTTGMAGVTAGWSGADDARLAVWARRSAGVRAAA